MKNALGAIQTILVLGGDSDIAIATAKQFVRRRARRIILAGRDRQALESRAESIKTFGPVSVETLEFDALDFDSHQEFVEQVFRLKYDIDLVLFAFGVLGDQARDERDAKAALETIQVNFVGAVSVAIPIIEKMKAQGHGSIVMMSSVAAERPRRSNFIYGASKAGIDWFSQGYGDALQASGVHVMVVRPGFVETKMTSHLDPAPFATNPQAVADAIVDGIARNREIVWAPGKLRWAMSALRHVPRTIFRKLDL